MNYDFSQLNDKEFEYLAIDLLSAFLETFIERFKPGKDSGVDGRFYTNNNCEIVIQCKHYLKSGYSKLISKIKREEIQKVNKINPKRYIFVTSLPLSRANKKEIHDLFSPHIISDSDVIGQEDLNSIISVNQKIEEKHYKLWISSSNVLQRIINNAIKGRSEYKLEQIQEKSYLYAETENHKRAIETLNNKNVLIITGEPGIGKTVLAENICLYYASKNYEFLMVENDLTEAENVYSRGSKQIFYFDDFLGSNFFEAIENKKDSHIMNFIDRIKKDKTKKFILTSRTNILNRGIQFSSVFYIKKLLNHEFLLAIGDFNAFDKAKILYNHIWFSSLAEDYIDEIYKEKHYKDIIKHHNFNPRLIEFITDVDRISTEPENYWDYILKNLSDPKDVWRDCFRNQTDQYVRNFVYLVVFNGKPIVEEHLKKSFLRIQAIERILNISHTEKDFYSVAQLAVKSFINRNIIKSEIIYTVFNPSITDYVINKFKNELQKLTNIFLSLGTIKSLEFLNSMDKAKIINNDIYLTILNKLFFDSKINKDINYQIYICYLFRYDETKRQDIFDLLNKIIISPTQLNEIFKLFEMLNQMYQYLDIVNYNFLLTVLDNFEPDYDDIRSIAKFLKKACLNDEGTIEFIKSFFEDYYISLAEQLKNDIDIDSYITYVLGYDGDEDIDFDEQGMRDAIYSGLIEEQTELGLDLIEIDLEDISSDVDINSLCEEYLDGLRYDGDDYRGGGNYSGYSDQAIDDLFQRT